MLPMQSAYRSLADAIKDLERHGHLVRVREEVDPNLQMAAIHRRVYQVGGPAIYFERVRNCLFPAVSNLFGTLERSRFLLRRSLRQAEALIALKANPQEVLKKPSRLYHAARAAMHALPLPTSRRLAPVYNGQCSISHLPLIKSWPKDGGPFITLPQVYTENPDKPGILSSNIGMYRVQMQGNNYRKNKQVGLHYQIQRGIGVHHARALDLGKKLAVSIFIGGPPAHTLAAIMPLPEALPEAAFAGVLSGRNFRYARQGPYAISADADFCILGIIEKELLPEGPFGDHLGYYALTHNFPALRVEKVYHRKNAIWPFTVVGRPPQEDSNFGALIHELTAPMVPVSIAGLKEMHAVDAAGVHPLMLAIGRESYTPYRRQRPAELLTIANAILGFGQASLAKYLLIVAAEDNLTLKATHIEAFFLHILERVDWRQDLHFQTCTTMDTLDYSGTNLNEGSRVVIAAAGQAKRKLSRRPPAKLHLPKDFKKPYLALPGTIVLEGPAFNSYAQAERDIRQLSSALEKHSPTLNKQFPLFVVVDDSYFCHRSLANFLWQTFTRSNPSHDIYGVGARIENKHWGCIGPLLIDARSKPHHAPHLEEDPLVEQSVEKLAAPGKSLHGIIG